MFGTIDLRNWRWTRPITLDGVIVRTESDDLPRWVVEALTIHVARRAWDLEQKEKVLTIKPVIHNGEPAVTLTGDMAGRIVVNGNVYQPRSLLPKEAYHNWVVKEHLHRFRSSMGIPVTGIGLAAGMNIELEEDGKTVKKINRITSLTLTNNPPDPAARIIPGSGRKATPEEVEKAFRTPDPPPLPNPWEGDNLDPNKEIAAEKAKVKAYLDAGLTEDGFPIPDSCPHHKSNVVDCDMCMGRGIWHGIRGADEVTYGC